MRRLIAIHSIRDVCSAVRFTVFQFANCGLFRFILMAPHTSIVCTHTMMGENPRFPMTSCRFPMTHGFQPITVLGSATRDICMGYPRSNPVITACKETFLINLTNPPKSYKSFV